MTVLRLHNHAFVCWGFFSCCCWEGKVEVEVEFVRWVGHGGRVMVSDSITVGSW